MQPCRISIINNRIQLDSRGLLKPVLPRSWQAKVQVQWAQRRHKRKDPTFWSILYCTILYYTTLYYTILYYTILYYAIQYYYTMLCYAIVDYTIP